MQLWGGMQLVLNDLSEERFGRIYRRALLGMGIAWRTVLAFGLKLPEETNTLLIAVIVLYAWGLVPYVALAGVATRVGHRGLLITASVLLVAGDMLSGMDVLRPGSSTAAVVLFTFPLAGLFGLVPVVWLLSWLLER